MCSNICYGLRNWSRLCCRKSSQLFRRNVGINGTRSFAVTHGLCRKIYRHGSPLSFTKRLNPNVRDTTVDIDEKNDSNENAIEEDENFNELQQLVDRALYISEFGHQVLVIQPYVKWGPEKKKLTRPELQLDEAVTLIKTLRNWKVVDKMIISLDRMNKPRVFGMGQLMDLRDRVTNNSKITAVFVSVNMLKFHQQEYLQELFGVPVYDRYTVVIHIFRNHATTREAKLQIKLAELPYLWSRLSTVERGSLKNFGGGQHLGTHWKGKEFHRFLLMQRESRIREQIKKLRLHRENLRSNRIKNEIPIVAVVGYTNSGKTSLIKALTGREKLEPQNYLFATLDVTVHEGSLPSSLSVLYVDTIGFMSDIPTSLFESFVATLEDVRVADVIIHVRDVSHPDNVAQNQNVKETLELLELPENLSKNMITVGNKIDLLSSEELSSFRDENMILISASNLIGTDILRNKIEKCVLAATERKIMIMKVKTSGDEYHWLMKNAVVTSENPDPENNNYTLLKVIITDLALARFKHFFIKEYYKERKQEG